MVFTELVKKPKTNDRRQREAERLICELKRGRTYSDDNIPNDNRDQCNIFEFFKHIEEFTIPLLKMKKIGEEEN
jgi:hypothetical protein